jgi:hypothetical protein
MTPAGWDGSAFGIELLDTCPDCRRHVTLALRHWHRVWYRCRACGLVWSPNVLSGRRRRGWWRCPNGCNG